MNALLVAVSGSNVTRCRTFGCVREEALVQHYTYHAGYSGINNMGMTTLGIPGVMFLVACVVCYDLIVQRYYSSFTCTYNKEAALKKKKQQQQQQVGSEGRSKGVKEVTVTL